MELAFQLRMYRMIQRAFNIYAVKMLWLEQGNELSSAGYEPDIRDLSEIL